MKVRYRGVLDPSSRPRTGGCNACGTARLGKTELKLLPEFSYYHNGRQFNFLLGEEYYVDDELGAVLLKKFSYRNGTKLMAFEEVV